jgi:plastocyanin
VRARYALAALFLLVSMIPGVASYASPPGPRAAAVQTLTWTTDGDTTRYRTAPTQAVAGETTIVFENSEATGNTIGMPHTLTFDNTTEGFNHDVSLNILANPFDPNDGRHTATVTLTPGTYRYFCSIPGHTAMEGELVVTAGGPDTTPPTVNATVTGTRDTAGNYVGGATVTVTASDAQSGVSTVEYQLDGGAWTAYTAPVVVTTVGAHMLHSRATDVAGNVSPEAMTSFTVVAPPSDSTPPTVSAQVTGTRDTAGNYVERATVTVTATDDRSGVSTVEYSLDGGAFAAYTAPVVVTAVGAHTLRHRATDNAGNTSTVGSVSFTVVAPPVEDRTPPETTATVSGIRDTGGNYVDRATVTIGATDSQSGVRTVEYAVDSGTWTVYTGPVAVTARGAHTVRYRATDNAGNAAAERSAAFTVVEPGDDACPVPDDRPTVVIDGYDTGVSNVDTGNGCTLNDLVAERAQYPDHAAFVRHVESVTGALVTDGVLTRREQGAIVRAAARSDIGS